MREFINKSREIILLFTFFFLFLFIINSGFITSGDIMITYLTAKNLVEKKTVYFDNPEARLYHQESITPDGKIVGRPSIFWAIFFIPFLLVAKIVSPILALPNRAAEEFGISLVNIILCPLIVVAFYKLVFLLSGQRKKSIALSIIFGLTSLLPVHAKSTSYEPLYILILITASYYLISYKNTQEIKFAYKSSVLIALLALFKIVNFIFAPVFLLGFAIFSNKQIKKSQIFILLAPTFLAFFLILLSNHLISGSPLISTYGVDIGDNFTTPFFEGLTSQLISLDYGLFIYSPISFLGLIYYLNFSKKFKLEAIFFAAIFIVNLLFYSFWYCPGGGEGGAVWGPRFLLVTEFPLFVALIPFFQNIRKRKLNTIILSIFILFSTVTQILGISIYPRQYFDIIWQVGKEAVVQKKIISQIPGHTKLFIHKIKGNREIYNLSDFVKTPSKNSILASYDQSSFETFQSFNFWFIHAKNIIKNSNLIKILFVSVILLSLFNLFISFRIFKLLMQDTVT